MAQNALAVTRAKSTQVRVWMGELRQPPRSARSRFFAATPEFSALMIMLGLDPFKNQVFFVHAGLAILPRATAGRFPRPDAWPRRSDQGDTGLRLFGREETATACRRGLPKDHGAREQSCTFTRNTRNDEGEARLEVLVEDADADCQRAEALAIRTAFSRDTSGVETERGQLDPRGQRRVTPTKSSRPELAPTPAPEVDPARTVSDLTPSRLRRDGAGRPGCRRRGDRAASGSLPLTR